MTYCVGMRLDRGLIFMSDTRTNAGVDDVSQVRKMRHWENPGERIITLLSAGNLATTQAVVSLLDERTKAPSERDPSIMSAPSMFQIATIVGDTLREVISSLRHEGPEASAPFRASLILGGQIAGSEPRLFLIYPEGNFIEAGDDSPFFQIGETKYGRPIIVRTFDPAMTFEDATRLLMVSFDSTIRSNLAVDLPLDLATYERDACKLAHQQRIEVSDPYFRRISEQWSLSLREAVNRLPPFEFETGAASED
ncbi:peptidase [Citromicrobium sp. WPS32]|uniref:peptidase n=1 Tax=Citromicrobium sp. WPS32 TaxID=1634517 RepID=UPI0006C8F757|nr:peptidase [Citromicrobium sp. WPS32]KPM15001.1 peptidase [Citromicrobium sp. WPS32]MAY77051.1 peptidase [Citromicrobium sp.]|tara:strand:- start:2235 stop:2990 length:756 start_codon:yes stop_codon:yes gene_type:complete